MKRNWFRLLAVAACLVLAVVLAGCGGDKNTASRDTIMVDLGEDAPTLDPTMSEDTQSARVAYDLFEGLVSFDQKLDPIPGLAERWDISPDKRTYTFYLRPGIKFSDDTPITADDVVFTWQRLVDPKVGSPYNFLGSNVVNGQAVIDGKLPVSELGVRAIDPRTVEIKLEVPDPSFLNICSMPNVAILSKANITKYGDSWTEPGKMVSSGAYKLAERVIKGYILLEKNEHYYDAANVAISKVKFLPIVETSSALNQFKSGGVDLTWSVPSDQYQSIKKEFGDQLHTVPQEALYY
ncbi:MAG: peptide ABC transporter substrate-binding protein, partial [Negativicutes bacterium]|nr:peptide ABC transporter substrate-binding protein [Negativicutes bacterium]